MKKTILLLIPLVFLAFQLSAQKSDSIPNSSYEEWNMDIEAPIDWGTPNPYTALAGVKCVFQDGDDPFDGNFSARLTSVAVLTFKVPGIVTLGWLTVDLITTEASVDGGIPWTSKPSNLKGQYKCEPQANDSCAVIVIFTEYIPLKGKRDTLGLGFFYSAAQTTDWTEFNVNINYFNEKIPDTMNIIVSSSASLFDPILGSTMWVDDVEFEGSSGIALDIIPEVRVNVYPNPTNDYLTFEFEKDVNQSDLIIFNVEGQTVRSTKVIQQKTTHEVGDLPAGTYYFHVIDGRKRVSSGTFLVGE